MHWRNPLWIFGDIVVLAVLLWELWRINRTIATDKKNPPPS
jgi:hypothetical protein